jgi:hypothetical protein
VADSGAAVLSDRELNRATLARQGLLARRPMPLLDAITRLVGLQAQEPPDPYLALWSRLEPFDPQALGSLLEERAVVRIVLMRGTIHLVTAEDALALRPLVQPVLDGELARHPDARQVEGPLTDATLAEPLALARRLLDERPRTMTELRAAFAVAFPDQHAPGLAYACRNLLPLVQVPPRGVWGKRGTVRLARLDTWVGSTAERRPEGGSTLDEMALRYLAAFGPATVADLGAWCRLAGMRDVVERLRPRLRVLRDGRGRELFDVPDGPLPGGDVPASVRFLPEYDNALLSHADRSRFFVAAERSTGDHETRIKGTVLHDGVVRATWGWDADDLVVSPASALSAAAREEVAAEGVRVLTFLGRPGEVRFSSPAGG